MFRKWAHGLVIGLLLGSLFAAFPAAQNYVWSSINGVPMAPGLIITSGGQISLPDGSATNPAIGFTSDLGSDVGWWRGATNQWFWGGGGAAQVIVNGSFVAATSFVLDAGNQDIRFTREAAATLQLGVDVNGAAVAQTIKAHDGITGTDIAGANLTLAAGRGTGAGAPGTLIFQTATALGSGTTAQTLATRLIIGATGAATLGSSAGTGAGAFYAGSYFVGTTAGADCTSAAAVTVVKGIVTGCS